MKEERKSITMELADGISLVAEQNIEPYEDEMMIFLNINGEIKDLARISFNDIFDSHANRTSDKSKMSIKIFANSDNENFTDEYIIPIEA